MALLPVIVVEADHSIELGEVSNHRPDRLTDEVLLRDDIISEEHHELSGRFVNGSLEDLRSAGIIRRHLVRLHYDFIVVVSCSLLDEREEAMELLRTTEGRDADRDLRLVYPLVPDS